jgi:hypothetical protein
VVGITDPAKAYFKDGLWAWDGTVWRKQPLLYGYTSALGARKIVNALAAGNNTLDIDAVPADEIWVVTNLAMRYTGTAPTRMTVTLTIDSIGYSVYRQETVVSNEIYDRQGWWVLAEGDQISMVIIGATLNDAASIWATGFITSIVE